jgi:hypothetical protein
LIPASAIEILSDAIEANFLMKLESPAGIREARALVRSLAACAGAMVCLGVVGLPPPAFAEVVVAGDSENLEVRASGANAGELIARLVDVLGVPIRHQGVGSDVIDGSRRGPLLHVLSQFFPQYLVVVKRAEGRVVEVTITKSGDRRTEVLEQPTAEETRRATEAFIPSEYFKK